MTRKPIRSVSPNPTEVSPRSAPAVLGESAAPSIPLRGALDLEYQYVSTDKKIMGTMKTKGQRELYISSLSLPNPESTGV